MLLTGRAALLDPEFPCQIRFADSRPRGTPSLLAPLITKHEPTAVCGPLLAPVHRALPVPRPPLTGPLPAPFTFTVRCPDSDRKKRRCSPVMSHFFTVPWVGHFSRCTRQSQCSRPSAHQAFVRKEGRHLIEQNVHSSPGNQGEMWILTSSVWGASGCCWSTAFTLNEKVT